jgi:hypothetical protein
MLNLERHTQKNHRCFPTDSLKSTMCNENRITQLVYVFVSSFYGQSVILSKSSTYKNMWNYQRFTHMIIYVNGTCVKGNFKINFID